MADKLANIERILMTADTVGGVWTYALELVKGLQAQHVQVHLATMGNPLTDDQWQQANELANLKVHESSYQLEWMPNPWQDVEKAGEWLLGLEQELSPDLIHLNNYTHATLAWNAPVLVVGHSDVVSWWQHVLGSNPSAEYTLYQQKVKEGLQAADMVVAPTEAYLNTLQSLFGPFQSFKVIANAREQKSFYKAEKQPFIVGMGRLWDEAKNLSICEKVAEYVDWPVKIAGDATHPATGKTLKIAGLEMLGKLNTIEVRELLAKASIYIMPAKYEPFGLSVLEAALSGCALVLGNIPTLRENWEDAALFIDTDNPRDVADKLNQLITNTNLRKELTTKAFSKAQNFSLEKQAKEYLSAYQLLISQRVTEIK